MKKIPDRQKLCNLSSLIEPILKRGQVSNVHLENHLRDFPASEAWEFERKLLRQAISGEMSDDDLEEWIREMDSSWIRAKMMDVQNDRVGPKPQNHDL